MPVCTHMLTRAAETFRCSSGGGLREGLSGGVRRGVHIRLDDDVLKGSATSESLVLNQLGAQK
jgi:hypothetical protein